MADKTNGKVVETLQEATQAEKSPDTFYVLIISLLALLVIGGVLLWWWGVFPSFGPGAAAVAAQLIPQISGPVEACGTGPSMSA
jgi:hypothetical protein